ncbi:hypothetical protein [Bacillus subtilis]
MKRGGVNRLSFGVQTFDDGGLERIGRTHRADDVFHTVNEAAKRFDNISIDFIVSSFSVLTKFGFASTEYSRFGDASGSR